MFVKIFAVFLGLAIIIIAIGFVVRLVINAKTNAEIKLMRAQSDTRANVEKDLVSRLDEIRQTKFHGRADINTNK